MVVSETKNTDMLW